MASNWEAEMTIELRVERAIDRLDKNFMAGSMSQAEYDIRIKAIRDWADKELNRQCFTANCV